MTWTLETSRGFESDKIAALAVPYLQGRFLDVGCGMRKVWPTAIGVDNGHHFGQQSAVDVNGDGTDLSMFADGSMDAVFSSHFLEHIERDKVPDVLREWTRVLKVGGNLVLYLPSANLYPKIGEPGANTDHKWNVFPGDVEAILKDIGSWELLESEERGETNEYSLFIVARKRDPDGWDWYENVWQRHPESKNRALVCRFGAIGDQIWASSILPHLKDQGYHVTYMSTPEAVEIVKHDPHIDAFWTQAKDYVPNAQLGPYWETVAQRFDLFINLSESVEGSLLALPGRLTHAYSDGARRKLFGHVNYLERTHDIACVPHEFNPRFYATGTEMRAAAAIRGNQPLLVWTLNGSANHKVWPWVHVVTKWLLDRTPLRIALLSDPTEIGKALQAGVMDVLRDNGADMDRVLPLGGGALGVRQALALCLVADCVVGPETGPLNAVCMEPMPKVIYLSHSSPDNLTKHWKNTTTLVPLAGCYPCHRLHFGWEHCHQDQETMAAACASSIPPERVFEAIMEAFGGVRAAA